MADRARIFDLYLSLGIRLEYSRAGFHHTHNADILAREAAIENGQPAADGALRALALDSVMQADRLLDGIAARAARDWERRP